MLKSYLAEGNVVVLEFGRHPAVEGAKPMATQLSDYRATPGRVRHASVVQVRARFEVCDADATRRIRR